MAKVCPPECLQIVLSGCCLLRIEEETVANDQRVLAQVSCEEARTYIRGVNAHHAEGTKKIRMQMRGCFACMLLGVVLYGVGLGVWVEEKRLRCEGRPCGLGEDPLVDKCCIFWCCGNEMRTSPVRARRLRAPPKKKKKKKGGPAAHPDGHKLKTRPDDRWDVWANETYFGITELCSLYDEDRPEDHTKRDLPRRHKCGICPASQNTKHFGTTKCKTMFEGNAKDYEVTWPLLFLIPFLAPFVFIVYLGCAYDCAVSRLYEEAFEEWRARGVVTHVNSQQKTCCTTSRVGYLGLWFNDDGCYTLPHGKHEPGRIIRDVSQEIVRLNLPIVLRAERGVWAECSCSSTPGLGLTDIALPTELVGRVPEEVWIKHTTKLGPIVRGLHSTATIFWFGICMGVILINIPFYLIHANHVAKKVDKDLRAWQTSFNADLASHGVFVKTQSSTWTSDDGYGFPASQWLAVALTENEAADLKAEPHLFGVSRGSDKYCLHTLDD